MNLQNATVLVTGGTSGIGRGVARALTGAGAKVAVTGRDEARLQEVARELGVLAIKADVTNEADVDRTYAEVLGAFGHLDALVNNAGAGKFAPLVDLSREDFDSIIGTNVTGAMLMARAAARHFVKRRAGNIINIGSTAALRGAPNGTAYYASKFALRGMAYRVGARVANMAACPSCVSYLNTYEKTVLLARACAVDDPVPADVPESLVQAILAAQKKAR